MENGAYLLCFNLFGYKSYCFSSNRLHRHNFKDCLLIPRFYGYLERRHVTGLPLVDSSYLKLKDSSSCSTHMIWLKYEPHNTANFRRAYQKLTPILQMLKWPSLTGGALVRSSQSSVSLISLEDIKLLLEQLQAQFKLFLLKLWSLEYQCREQLKWSIRVSEWKVKVPSHFQHIHGFFEQLSPIWLYRALPRVTTRDKKSISISADPTLSCRSSLKSLRKQAVDDDSAVSSTIFIASRRLPTTYTTKLTFKPFWFEKIQDDIRRSLLSNSVTKSLTEIWKEPAFKVHSLLHWQMEAFAEQDLLRHRIHLKWKYYPERLRKRRVIRGTHLSISRWNKVALTLSVVILRSATDTLWFIIRPIFIEGYHILHGSIQKAIELLWTDKSGDIQSPSSKGLLQVTVAKNFRDRTHLENSMSIILSNFTTFWKFERALSKISRKAILWGVVEEGSSTKVDGIGRQSNVDRNELFTTRSSYYDEETNHSSGFFPIGILELTGVGFILFLFRLFPFLSESLVDICTFLFQLFAIYLFGTFTLATWRIVTESVHFCRVYETLQGHFSILLRHSMITKMNGNETIDIIAWEVNDKDELEKYSLCKYVEELWEEGICRAEMILRRIPSVLVESSPMGWQLLSLFEREECEIERIA